MLAFFVRAIFHPVDYFGLLKKYRIKFKEKINEGNGCYSFIFDVHTPINWKAGQHAVFTMPHKNIVGKKWRAFSISSSAAEGVIRITTTIPENPSDFKHKLTELKYNENIVMHGPFGEFHAHKSSKKIIGIAGGVGITPFRAIAYEIANNINQQNQLELIYAGKNNYFTFKYEFDTFATHPNINIHYSQTPDEVSSLTQEIVKRYGNKALYFISGSPNMIISIKKQLYDLGIKKIINDSFNGY